MKNTKAIFVSFIFSFLFLNLTGQERLISHDQEKIGIKSGDYLKVDEYKVAEGTWQWKSADSVFTLVLRKEKFSIRNDGVYTDILIGRFSFKVGSQYLIDAISENSDNLRGVDVGEGSIGKFRILFVDRIKGKNAQGIFELSPENSNIAYWEIGNPPGIYVVPEGKKFDPGFSIPTKMTLHRIIE